MLYFLEPTFFFRSAYYDDTKKQWGKRKVWNFAFRLCGYDSKEKFQIKPWLWHMKLYIVHNISSVKTIYLKWVNNLSMIWVCSLTIRCEMRMNETFARIIMFLFGANSKLKCLLWIYRTESLNHKKIYNLFVVWNIIDMYRITSFCFCFEFHFFVWWRYNYCCIYFCVSCFSMQKRLLLPIYFS